jgi:hypothetical protein
MGKSVTVDFLVMAETAVLDVTGCVSIVRIGHTAQIHQFPGSQVLCVVAQITGERTEVGGHALSVRLLDADNVEHWECANGFEIPEPKVGHLYAGFCAMIKSVLTFPHPGTYRLEARVDGVLQRTTRLLAVQVPPEVPSAPA